MEKIKGRFAPSPSGRMHLGNAFCALLAWLACRSAGGTMTLRVEDLDPERCRPTYAWRLMEDLEWMGLDWDQGLANRPIDIGKASGGRFMAALWKS